MRLFLSCLETLAEARVIDSTSAWAIIVAEGAAIIGLAGYIVHQQKKHDKRVAAHEVKVTEMGAKINEQYDKRISDMKDTLELVSTLERVVNKERKGGK